MLEKKDIRKKYKILRKQFSKEAINALSEQITAQFDEKIDYQNKKISLFLPIETQLEVNTFILLKTIEKKAKIYAPRSNFEDFSMKHFQITSNSTLKKNKYDIPEPEEGEEILDEQIEIVIAPLLAINDKGYRVGYGKGFYDRFLKKCSSKYLFVGVNLFENIEKFEDYSENDIPLHICITPTKIHYFER